MRRPKIAIPEKLALPAFASRGKGCFCVRVEGNGLTKGILNKDKIILMKQPRPKNGQVVLALVGGTPFLGRYYERGQFIALRTIDKEQTYFVAAKEVRVLGAVKGVLREFE